MSDSTSPSNSPITSEKCLPQLRDRVRKQLNRIQLVVPQSFTFQSREKPAFSDRYVYSRETISVPAAEIVHLIWNVSDTDIQRIFQFWKNQSALCTDSILSECFNENTDNSLEAELMLVVPGLVQQEDWVERILEAKIEVDPLTESKFQLIPTPKKPSHNKNKIKKNQQEDDNIVNLQWHVRYTIMAEDILLLTTKKNNILRDNPGSYRLFLQRFVIHKSYYAGHSGVNTYQQYMWNLPERVQQRKQAEEEKDSEFAV